MENHHLLASDDENDGLLFDRMQEHVLANYPNPQRLGCLDHDTLQKLVMTPEALDLTDVRFLHVFKCAECTRELIELRRLREAGLSPDNAKATSPSLVHPLAINHRRRCRLSASLAAFAAFVRRRFLSLKVH